MEFIDEDCKSLLADVKKQEKELILKRRWLIGVPISKRRQRELKLHNDRSCRTVPEDLLREEDVSYETIKAFVEKGAGVCNAESKDLVEDNMRLVNSADDIKKLFSLLNDMTNKGLCSFTEIVMGGSNFEKTRWKMKKVIKECLKELRGERRNAQYMKIVENLSPLLKDPHNFRCNTVARLTLETRSHRDAAINILDGLKELPTLTLCVMYRKLRGIKGYVPQLKPRQPRQNRDALIKRLRRDCMGLLPEEGDELEDRLLKAMEVAGLTLKLIQGSQYVTEFRKFSPEIILLQNEIATSIWLLEKKSRVGFPVLKKLQLLLDPQAKSSNRFLRNSLTNMLTEFLFECSDMESIPKCLLKVLAIIEKGSKAPLGKCFSEKKVKEEVECILSVSAQIKQIVWDLIPEHDFDLEFADAYKGDLYESEDDDTSEDNEIRLEHSENGRLHSGYSDEQIEGIGEVNPTDLNSPAFVAEKVVGTHEPPHDLEKQLDLVSSSFSFDEENSISDKQTTSRNQYLVVQAASDEASMVAYRLVGHMLDKFAQIEGCEVSSDDVSYLGGCNPYGKDRRVAKEQSISLKEDGCFSVVIQEAVELIPSFPESGKERLEDLMGSS